jgi:hypothetical protein
MDAGGNTSTNPIAHTAVPVKAAAKRETRPVNVLLLPCVQLGNTILVITSARIALQTAQHVCPTLESVPSVYNLLS